MRVYPSTWGMFIDARVTPATASRTAPLWFKGQRPPRRFTRIAIRCDSDAPPSPRAGAGGVRGITRPVVGRRLLSFALLRQVAKPLAVRQDYVPWHLAGAGVADCVFERHDVITPQRSLGIVGLADLPVPLRILQSF